MPYGFHFKWSNGDPQPRADAMRNWHTKNKTPKFSNQFFSGIVIARMNSARRRKVSHALLPQQGFLRRRGWPRALAAGHVRASKASASRRRCARAGRGRGCRDRRIGERRRRCRGRRRRRRRRSGRGTAAAEKSAHGYVPILSSALMMSFLRYSHPATSKWRLPLGFLAIVPISKFGLMSTRPIAMISPRRACSRASSSLPMTEGSPPASVGAPPNRPTILARGSVT